ncbi:extracellular solute-binding protein [Thorsellia anophelis]|uniref:Putrescine-binding periplasmic protein n=1 Tax=Thorsellia anophelis DSM 18579 TaxID=1123402 RepID=A0A1H9YMW0_9GAMM|nr:extracellular solute-binding protein [Thorsellia anophelis]SES70385.1 putrescine transport system substrate-binding protein [Thorsellia anophelis DSM 18579]
MQGMQIDRCIFKKWYKIYFVIFIMGLSSLNSVNANEKRLFIYNWSDYISPKVLENFEKKTGISVVYDTYDSSEELESYIMTMPPKYDLVVPSSTVLAKGIDAHLYQPLDKTKLPDFYNNLDPNILELIANDDPDNQFALPYMWISTGIGYNSDKIEDILKRNLPKNPWDLVFDVNSARKLAQCGIAWSESPSEMVSLALNYLGLDPNSAVPEDYVEAANLLRTISPYVKYIDSAKLIEDLSTGKVCVVIGWSGDIYQAIDKAQKNDDGINIEYKIPTKGAFASFDVFAMTSTAENVEEAYTFLNYLLDPQVIAEISDYVFYANANVPAKKYMNKELVSDNNIYPPQSVLETLYTLELKSPRIERAIQRVWRDLLDSKIKMGLVNDFS